MDRVRSSGLQDWETGVILGKGLVYEVQAPLVRSQCRLLQNLVGQCVLEVIGSHSTQVLLPSLYFSDSQQGVSIHGTMNGDRSSCPGWGGYYYHLVDGSQRRC